MDDRVFDLLQKADWPRISLELTDYAGMKVQRLRWRTGSRGDLPQGNTAEDLAYDAIGRVLGGERRWDPDQNPELLPYLKAVVDSLVSHLGESDEHRRVRRFPQTEEGADFEEVLHLADPEAPTARHLPQRPATPEEDLLRKEREGKVVDEIFKAVHGDAELELLVDAVMEGHTKPAEIAQAKGMEPRRVYQLIRKLKGRLLRRGDVLGTVGSQERKNKGGRHDR